MSPEVLIPWGAVEVAPGISIVVIVDAMAAGANVAAARKAVTIILRNIVSSYIIIFLVHRFSRDTKNLLRRVLRVACDFESIEFYACRSQLTLEPTCSVLEADAGSVMLT